MPLIFLHALMFNYFLDFHEYNKQFGKDTTSVAETVVLDDEAKISTL